MMNITLRNFAWPALKFHRLRCNPAVVFGLAFAILIWGVAFSQNNAAHDTRREELAAQAADLALTFEQHVGSTISELDNLLMFIREIQSRSNGVIRWDSVINSNYRFKAGVARLSIIDASGIMVASTDPAFQQQTIDLNDRPHFIVHKTNRLDDLHISAPLLSRLTNRWSVHLSRRLTDASGKFDGVIVASIDPSLLVRTYEKLQLGPSGGVAVMGIDDVIRAGTGTFAQRLSLAFREPTITGEVKVRRGADLQTTEVVEAQTIDGKSRLVAMRNLNKMPLQIMAAITDDSRGVSFWTTRHAYLALAALCSLMLLVAVLAVLRSQRQAKISLDQRNAMEIAKQVAEASATNRSMFLAVMSHEIRTPINGILGSLDLIRDSSLDDRSRKCVSMALESGEILLGLIDDVLLFSKSDHTHIDIAREPLVIADLCNSIHDSLLSPTTLAGNVFHDIGLPGCILARAGRRATSAPDSRQPDRQRQQVHAQGPDHRRGGGRTA